MMKIIFFFLFLMSSLVAQARPVPEYNQSLRALGMGGAYISVVNDSDALFYNPAALSRLGGIDWKIMDVSAGVNGLDVYEDFRDIDSSDSSSYSQFFGKDIWFRAGGKSAFAIPNFGIGVYTDNYTSLVLHNPAFPQFNTEFISDYAVVIGGSFPIGPASSMGITAKKINRWGGQQDIDLGVIASGNMEDIADQFQNKGVGYGIDTALMTTLPVPLSPTVSLVWQDVGSTAFNRTDGTKAPPRIRDNLSLGMATSLDLPGLDWVAAFEYRHITESEYQLGKKLHLGTEISLPLIDIRAGLNQGYVSYGAGLDLFFLRFDVASYAEEMGEYPGQTPQNRIQVGLSVDLSFDANFSLVDSKGKKRKLKQRR